MKNLFRKGLSLILAVTLMLCVLPAAGAETAETTTAPTYEYVFTKGALGFTDDTNFANNMTGYTFNNKISTGVWAPKIKLSSNVYKFFESGYKLGVKGTDALLGNGGSNGTAFEITVEKAGIYKPTMTYYQYQWGPKINVYLVDTTLTSIENATDLKNVSVTESDVTKGIILLGSFETYNADAKKEWSADYRVTNAEFDFCKSIQLKAQKYYLVIAMDGANSKWYNSGSYSTTGTKSSSIYYINSFGLDKVETTTDESEEVTENISFVATSNVGEDDMMDVKADDFTYDEFTDSIPVGTFVKVTAPEKTGYEFKHWVRGSADNGVYVSDNPEYTFTALTNTFLTAIYEQKMETEGDTAVVEFYNGNGQYLEKATSKINGTVALPANEPEMTGFEFANQWKTEDGIFDATTPLVKKLTRAVAQFNTPSTTFTVTCDNEEVLLTYGSKHTFTNDKAVYWMRDNTVVYHGTSYTHAAWDATEITTSENGELVPVVLLDADAKDGARMIEYNAAGKNVIEVGLLFGDEDVNIGSCSSKATSQYKNQHGQFTAKPYGTETTARGYMIYKEGNSYKVIYSE